MCCCKLCIYLPLVHILPPWAFLGAPRATCPCLQSLLGHDECSPISTVQAAERKGKQTQQATVEDPFSRPHSCSQASAPCPGPDSYTSKSCSLRKEERRRRRRRRKKKPHRWKCVNSQFSCFVSFSLVKACSSFLAAADLRLMEEARGVRNAVTCVKRTGSPA